MTTAAFRVPTRTLIAQALETERRLDAPANAERAQVLSRNGLDAGTFLADLKRATQELQQAEAEQERLKTACQHVRRQTAEAAREGKRWMLLLHARARAKIAAAGAFDELNLRERLRFGELKNDRPITVGRELVLLVLNARPLQPQLEAYGVDDAFVQQGEQCLHGLVAGLRESTAVLAKQKQATRRVREAEKNLSRLLRQLEAADEAAALEHDGSTEFGLHVVRAELRRKKAAYKARLEARKQQSTDS